MLYDDFKDTDREIADYAETSTIVVSRHILANPLTAKPKGSWLPGVYII